jgi:hypothetical protein
VSLHPALLPSLAAITLQDIGQEPDDIRLFRESPSLFHHTSKNLPVGIMIMPSYILH